MTSLGLLPTANAIPGDRRRLRDYRKVSRLFLAKAEQPGDVMRVDHCAQFCTHHQTCSGLLIVPDSGQQAPREPLWFAKTLSDSDFNRIQGCRPQAKCDSTLGWSTPFGYS